MLNATIDRSERLRRSSRKFYSSLLDYATEEEVRILRSNLEGLFSCLNEFEDIPTHSRITTARYRELLGGIHEYGNYFITTAEGVVERVMDGKLLNYSNTMVEAFYNYVDAI